MTTTNYPNLTADDFQQVAALQRKTTAGYTVMGKPYNNHWQWIIVSTGNLDEYAALGWTRVSIEAQPS